MAGSWDSWVDGALSKLEALNLMISLRPITMTIPQDSLLRGELKSFDWFGPWDRASVEIQMDESTFQKSIHDDHSFDDDNGFMQVNADPQPLRKLILFSGNDYLGSSCHPTVRKVAAEVCAYLDNNLSSITFYLFNVETVKVLLQTALQHGIGPRGSTLICGYTNYHKLLESVLADLTKKEDCLLCPTGFSANTAFMAALGSVSSLLATGRKPSKAEKIAIFSDALNHASIIDGIRLAERQQEVELYVYRHCDMVHLNSLLSSCRNEKKVVITDSLFSMDGDFAPLLELVKLRTKYGFLLAIDDAWGTLICGENGGGVAEELNCQSDIDICIGTMSKAIGSQGGFIACSKKWKQLLLCRGRSFMFSTAIPLPTVAAAYTAVKVAIKEKWRRKAIWNRVQDFRDLTQIHIMSPIVSIVVGSEENSLVACRHLMASGFHVVSIRPPAVSSTACRLRITLNSSHTRNDIKKLVSALSSCVNLTEIGVNNTDKRTKL